MKRCLQLVSVLLLLTTISMAQEVPGAVEKKKKGCGCAYSSVYSIGVLEGEGGAQPQLQTIQGIRYGKWFAGIGVGLDYYHVRGIPVFLDIRRELLARKSTPFVYADGGIHFAWASSDDKPSFGTAEFDNGVYFDVGLGYKFGTGKKRDGILLSAGYSYKYLREVRTTPYCNMWMCNFETSEYFRYKLNRLSIKLGVNL